MEFLEGLDRLPLRLTAVDGLRPVGLFLGAQKGYQVEVAHLEATARPGAARLREVWKERAKGRAAPILVVATHGAVAHICGPAGDEPPVQQDVPLATADRICREALQEPDKESVLRFLRAALPEADSPTPGLRNEDLLATHELRNGVPQRDGWDTACKRSLAIADQRGKALVQALGFTVETGPGAWTRLVVGARKVAVAVFLERSESPDVAAERFTSKSPVSYALAKADDEGLPYVVVTCGSAIRLYPVRQGLGVGRRGRPETFVEIHLGLIEPKNLGYLWLLLSADALQPGGTFECILEDSGRYAAALGRKLRQRIYEGVVWRLASAIAQGRKIRRPTVAELQETYRATLTLLFRLLFIAYAEDKDLLPYKTNPRYKARSLKHVAKELLILKTEGKEFDKGATYWEETRRLFKAVDQGQKEWDVPAYNGGMFSPDSEEFASGAILDKVELGNNLFAEALAQLLLVETDKEGLQPVDFRSLGVREFGTIYEGLLECELSVAEEDLALDRDQRYRPLKNAREEVVVRKGAVYLHDRSGSRKASGSYYTKDFAVEHLLENTLEPALADHLARLDTLDDVACSEIVAGSSLT